MHFEASQAGVWSLSCYKDLKKSHLQVIHFATSWSRCKSLWSSGMRRKQKFWGFKSETAIWLLLFAFSPPPFFRFSCLIFFSFAGHLVGFILAGKVFWKAFRILELGERKCREVVKQDFMEIFISMLHGFLPFSLVSLTELGSFWNGLKDLFTLHKLADKVVFDLWNWWHHKR